MLLIALIGLICVVLALHPYVTYPLSLYLMRKAPLAPADPRAAKPSVAICMCAYNEAAVIVAKVESLISMAQSYGPAEVFIYVDGSEDGTRDLLEPYAGRVHLTVAEDRRGKTVGMKRLIAGSRGDVLAFTDANVLTPTDALDRLVAALGRGEDVCGASARLRYTNASQSYTAAAGAVYWSIEESIKSLESDRTGLVGVDGALFIIQRDAYPLTPDHLIDDLYVSLSVLIQGKRLVTVPDVVVEERSAVDWREEFLRKRRIACQAWNVHTALFPQLAAMPAPRLYAYVSHRVLKWLTPFTLLAAGVCFSIALALLLSPLVAAAAICAGFAMFGAGLAIGARPFRLAGMALMSLAGVAAGIIESVFLRRTYTVWEPAKSVRS